MVCFFFFELANNVIQFKSILLNEQWEHSLGYMFAHSAPDPSVEFNLLACHTFSLMFSVFFCLIWMIETTWKLCVYNILEFTYFTVQMTGGNGFLNGPAFTTNFDVNVCLCSVGLSAT